MKHLLATEGPCIDLCYIDPPFNRARNYHIRLKKGNTHTSFKDSWRSVDSSKALQALEQLKQHALTQYLSFIGKHYPSAHLAYLAMMGLRLYYIHALLKNTGSLYLHCDPTMSHYLKAMCDLVFGVSNYRNEIVWGYKFGGHSPKGFAAKHDIIFRYSKSHDFVFHSHLVREFETKSGWGQRKDGKLLTDWWGDIPSLNTMARERTGYPTQKPLRLLVRILESSSEVDDLVADFFCGSGTTLAAAQMLNRRWIGVDSHPLSIQCTEDRLRTQYGNNLRYTRIDADSLLKN